MRKLLKRWYVWLGLFLLLAFVSATALIAWLVYRQQQREQVIADIRQLGGHYAEGAPSFPGWAEKPRAVIGDRVLAPFAKPSRPLAVRNHPTE